MPKTQASSAGGCPWGGPGPRAAALCAREAGRRGGSGAEPPPRAGGSTAPSRGRSEDSRAALREAVQGSAPPAAPGGSGAQPEPAKLSLPGPRQEPADGHQLSQRVQPGSGLEPAAPGMLGAALAIRDQTHLLLWHLTPREKGLLSKRRRARGKGPEGRADLMGNRSAGHTVHPGFLHQEFSLRPASRASGTCDPGLGSAPSALHGLQT